MACGMLCTGQTEGQYYRQSRKPRTTTPEGPQPFVFGSITPFRGLGLDPQLPKVLDYGDRHRYRYLYMDVDVDVHVWLDCLKTM